MTRDFDGKGPHRRDRGQSISINYTLSLIIVTLLMSGLFISMSGFLDAERERVTRSELGVVGNRIAADISTADRLAQATSGDAAVSVTTTIPSRVAGSRYQVEITSSQFKTSKFWNVSVNLQAPVVSVNRTVKTRTRYEVVTSTIDGGEYTVAFDGSTLEVTDA